MARIKPFREIRLIRALRDSDNGDKRGFRICM